MPPATNEWVVAEVVAGALQQLRLGDTDPDMQRIEECAETAVSHVDHEVDRELPGPVTASMFTAAVQATVEYYTRPANSFDAFAFAMQTGTDPRANIRATVAPDKERWGIA